VDDLDLFLIILKQFFVFFHNQTIFTSLIHELLCNFPNLDADINTIVEGNQVLYGDTEEEAAAIGYKVLLTLNNNPKKFQHIGFKYKQASSFSEIIEALRINLLIPFYEYIDEHLDDQRAVLSLLIRYKHRSEWFQRDRLFNLGEKEMPREKDLTIDLYSYLYDNGIDFYIEPSSITGEIDIISMQKADDPLLLDAKLFDADSRGKTYIIKAFQQIYTYTQQFNKPIGYLLIYKITDKDLYLNLRLESDIPCLIYNNKTIFFVVVDIFSHPKPVSQRQPVNAIELTEDDFIKIIKKD
jgi:hypothetical protein